MNHARSQANRAAASAFGGGAEGSARAARAVVERLVDDPAEVVADAARWARDRLGSGDPPD